jgi:hypothetical protein
MVHKKSRKYKAWLVTWEWVGDHAKRDDKIVAVLDPRWRPDHVREFVELLYLNLTYGIGERMYYALHRRKNPYQAKYIDSLSRWPPMIHCGDNPFLMAHLVEDLQVEMHDNWTETATWRDVRSRRHKTFTTRLVEPKDLENVRRLR